MTNQALKKSTTLENVFVVMGLLSILIWLCLVATVHHISVSDVHKQLDAIRTIDSSITYATKPRDLSYQIKHKIPSFWILASCTEKDLIVPENLEVVPCDVRPALLYLVSNYFPDRPLGHDNSNHIRNILDNIIVKNYR